MKNIAVVVAGTGQIKDLAIKPGTTAKEILTTVGISDGTLSRQNGPSFAADENVYEAVTDGQKLFASATADVGGKVL